MLNVVAILAAVLVGALVALAMCKTTEGMGAADCAKRIAGCAWTALHDSEPVNQCMQNILSYNPKCRQA
jgi:hypothetical protein